MTAAMSQPIYPDNDPLFWQMTAATIREFIAETNEKIQFAKKHGAEEIFIIGLSDQRARAAAELARLNGNGVMAPVSDDPIAATLQVVGLSELQSGASMAVVEETLCNLVLLLVDADDIRRATVREVALKKLDAIGISAPSRLLDAVLQRWQ